MKKVSFNRQVFDLAIVVIILAGAGSGVASAHSGHGGRSGLGRAAHAATLTPPTIPGSGQRGATSGDLTTSVAPEIPRGALGSENRANRANRHHVKNPAPPPKSPPPSTAQGQGSGSAAAAAEAAAQAAAAAASSATAAPATTAATTKTVMPAPAAAAAAPAASPDPTQPATITSSGGSSGTNLGGGYKSLNDCVALWEPALHMSKTEWRQTCQRTSNGLNLPLEDVKTTPARHAAHGTTPRVN